MHTVTAALRNGRREGDERRDYRDVFREFIDHLNHAARRRDTSTAKKKVRRRNSS